MASLQTLERRILALEARLSEVEGGYGESIYRMGRQVTKLEINVDRLLAHFNIPSATENDVDTALDDV